MQMQLWNLPASRAYSCEEYEERHANDGDGGGSGDDDSDGGRGMGRGLNMKERLAVCTATEKQRLAFGKVSAGPLTDIVIWLLEVRNASNSTIR